MGDDGLEDDISYALTQEALKRTDYDEVTRLMKATRNVDLRLVDSADFMIVNLDLDSRPCGTWEEIFTANREKKPIIVKCKCKQELPPWLFAVCPHQLFFETWDEIKEYVRHIDQDQYVDKLGRWVFFDLEPKIMEIVSADYDRPGGEE